MSLISWTDDFSVGVESIDMQHKRLVEMINALNDACAKGQVDEVIGKVFNNLAVYTKKHFEYEETLFRETGYRDEAAHKQQHAQLIEQVSALKTKLDAGEQAIGDEVLAFLKKWLTEHIMKEDKAYSDHLIRNGIK